MREASQAEVPEGTAELERLMREGALPTVKPLLASRGGGPHGDATFNLNVAVLEDQAVYEVEARVQPSESWVSIGDVLPKHPRSMVHRVTVPADTVIYATIIELRYRTRSGHILVDSFELTLDTRVGDAGNVRGPLEKRLVVGRGIKLGVTRA